MGGHDSYEKIVTEYCVHDLMAMCKNAQWSTVLLLKRDPQNEIVPYHTSLLRLYNFEEPAILLGLQEKINSNIKANENQTNNLRLQSIKIL